MYTVTVRDHFMIAHSFHGEAFGPAQRLHGATYVVDLEFRRPELDANGMVVDIGLATEVLKANCGRIDLAILDVVMPGLSGPAAYSQMTAFQPDLRVIFATGYTAETVSLNSTLEKGIPILQKPYSLKNLGQIVRSTLDCPRFTSISNDPSLKSADEEPR